MKGSVKLPVFIDDARKLVNTTQLRAKYLGASYEAEYCQWQTLHGLGSLMETASLIITPNAYLEGKLIASYPPDPIGDFDVTRATTATRVNSQGLVELVPYNYKVQSENLTLGVGLDDTNITTITANTTETLDPFGGNNAEKYNGSTGQYADSYNFIPQNSVVTSSLYVKAGTATSFTLRLNASFGTYAFATFNLTNGTVTTTGTDGYAYISSAINSVGNGWYRCSLTYNFISFPTNRILLAQNGSIYVFGWQLVEGSVAKDYQKTETRLNIPRLDYSNGTCPSILVEPQRTNLVLWSEDFTNAVWQSNGSFITPNTQTAPSGELTADTFSTAQSNLIWQTIAASINTTYTLSLYVKLGTATNLCLVANNTAAWNTIGGQSFDSSDGLNTSTWTRIKFTFTTPILLPAGAINIHIGGNAETGLTQSTGTVFIWGAQLE